MFLWYESWTMKSVVWKFYYEIRTTDIWFISFQPHLLLPKSRNVAATWNEKEVDFDMMMKIWRCDENMIIQLMQHQAWHEPWWCWWNDGNMILLMTIAQGGCVGSVPVWIGFFERSSDDDQKCLYGAPEEGMKRINPCIRWNFYNFTYLLGPT